MVNECLIQYEQKNYDKFIKNSRNLLFGGINFVLEPENISSKKKIFLILIQISLKTTKLYVYLFSNKTLTNPPPPSFNQSRIEVAESHCISSDPRRQ